MLVDEIQDQRQHMQAAIRGWQVYPHLAVRLVALGAERMLYLLQVGQHRRTGAVERDTRLGQRQGAGGTVEQPYPKALLQARDTLAHSRSGEVQPFGRGSETAQVSDRDKDVQTLEPFR